ncbi:hypothetical protein CRE_06999 [Caenorhabditis remanei]|uniref:NTF2-like domain-containing protein n=1 Tax=Caenorhabditis remanei TaxID=31234 RepID=E3NB46_CAERE|nr:hypothetical protein CRE_06999 [Caenorhabditis remanei]
MLRDFKFILLLLLVSTPVFAESRSKYGKLEELLKTLGKRYTNSGVFKNDILISQKQMRNWMNEPDEYIAKVKLETAERITQHIRWQSSISDVGWSDHAAILMELQDDRMTAEVCGAKEELNKVKFNSHLKRLRQTFDSIQDIATYSFEVEPTAKDVLKMISRVELKSQWGYTITQIWNIDAKLLCREGECVYRFFHIKLGGGCTEYGIVNHNYTEMNNRKEALKQLKQGCADRKISEFRTLKNVRVSKFRNFGISELSEFQIFGISESRTIPNFGFSEFRNFGIVRISDFRTFGMSEYSDFRTFGIFFSTDCPIYPYRMLKTVFLFKKTLRKDENSKIPPENCEKKSVRDPS